ncbi:MAG: ECF RNA polymerase sigma-E factor [Candidatus Aerophobetes bacterium ADurb.Bin490]|nr:MAG: ECF RNA polymerase sigma-E factor [Candidatus Aerophobetes bacterium ADurb.Bin490]
MNQALLSLPENQRMAMVLLVYEDKSYKEIAQILSVSVSSVESLIFRAREALKNKLLNK